MNGPLDISPLQLSLAAIFLLAAGATSLANRLGLERDILIGSLRTVIQLLLMGFVLKWVFAIQNWAVVLILFGVMIAFGVHIVRGRVKERSVSYLFPAFISMLLGYTLVTIVVTAAVVQVEPWWKPEYFLPIGGMVVGNSITALAISLDRLFSELKNRRDEVEMRLALGATSREASHDIMKDALKAGMIPSINSMMGVGLVFIPGMMTGQILAGADPAMAVRYQIVVMFMIVGATAISSLIVLNLVRGRCFGRGENLVLR